MIHVGDLECFCTADAHRGSNGCKNRHDGHFGMLCEHCSEHHAEEYEVTDKTDPTAVEVIETESAEESDDSTSLSEKQIDELSKINQLSNEEDIVGSGEDIIKKLPEESDEDREKRLFKYVFPHAYEKRYGKP